MSTRHERRAAAAISRARAKAGEAPTVVSITIPFAELGSEYENDAFTHGLESVAVYARLGEFLRRRIDAKHGTGEVPQFAPIFYVVSGPPEALVFQGRMHPNIHELGRVLAEARKVHPGYVLIMSQQHPHDQTWGIGIRVVHEEMKTNPVLAFRHEGGIWSLYDGSMVRESDSGRLVVQWTRREQVMQ